MSYSFFNDPGDFLFGNCFLELIFKHKKINKTEHTGYSLMKIVTPPSPKVHHDLTCCHNYKGDESIRRGPRQRQGVGSVVKAKVRDMEGEYKVVENKDDNERGGGICLGCGGEE